MTIYNTRLVGPDPSVDPQLTNCVLVNISVMADQCVKHRMYKCRGARGYGAPWYGPQHPKTVVKPGLLYPKTFIEPGPQHPETVVEPGPQHPETVVEPGLPGRNARLKFEPLGSDLRAGPQKLKRSLSLAWPGRSARFEGIISTRKFWLNDRLNSCDIASQNPFVSSCPDESNSSCRRGYTLVELLISLALLAVLFTLLGSMLHGMSRISRLAEDNSVRDREVAFCFDMMRKELGEMVLDQKKMDFNFLSGENHVSYTTTRDELLARDSIPGGVKRVEWRYDPAAQCLVRKVSMLIDGKREASAPVETRFFSELKGFETYIFDGVNWLKMTGISELVPQTTSIAVRLIFPSETGESKFVETAFILPNETFSSKK